MLNCFPNTYAVGMASLGYQTIFKLYASSDKTHCFRYFTDWSENHPKEIDLMTFSISWELDFINLLEIFKQLNIPFKASERGPEHPLILGGGPVLTANPEPWAEFFDLIAIGDCEDNTNEIIDTALDCFVAGAPRNDLSPFTKIPGIYVPSLKNQVERQKSKNSQLQISSVIAPESAWQDTGLLEVVRSCPEMCRFCLASYLSLPFRAPELEGDLIPKVDQLLKHTKNIGLLGASVTQHPEFMDLLEYLAQRQGDPDPDASAQDRLANVILSPSGRQDPIAPQDDNIKVQLASVRASTVTQEMCELLVKLGSKNLTIAIETGSERLRDVINKKLPEQAIFDAVKHAYAAGMKQIKLYGMVGLPHETDEDIDATIDLLTRVKQATPQIKIIWGCSIFTPKAQTPFQDYGVDQQAENKLKKLIKALRSQGIEVREESFKWAQVQALISRGDRTVNDVLVKVYQSRNTGFGIYKKLMEPAEYKHFVFDTWQGQEYPWAIITNDKQNKMLEEHKQDAILVNEV